MDVEREEDLLKLVGSKGTITIFGIDERVTLYVTSVTLDRYATTSRRLY